MMLDSCSLLVAMSCQGGQQCIHVLLRAASDTTFRSQLFVRSQRPQEEWASLKKSRRNQVLSNAVDAMLDALTPVRRGQELEVMADAMVSNKLRRLLGAAMQRKKHYPLLAEKPRQKSCVSGWRRRMVSRSARASAR